MCQICSLVQLKLFLIVTYLVLPIFASSYTYYIWEQVAGVLHAGPKRKYSDLSNMDLTILIKFQ
jgi:hypothetical protein